MKNISLVLLTMILLSFSLGCEKENLTSESVDLNIKLNYDGAPLVFLKDVSYPDGRTLLFNRLSFFISDVSLFQGSTAQKSEDVKMVNFNSSNGELSKALIGKNVSFSGFEEGDYSKISICIGVNNKNNEKTPADFKSNSDLSDQSEYWAGWNSYIFFRAEGFLDANRDGTKELGFSLHTGSKDAYRCFEMPINLEVKKGGTNTVNLSMDVKKIFGSTKIFEIDKNPQLHSLTQLPQVIELSNNIQGAFKVD
jgi:hypothetical protein